MRYLHASDIDALAAGISLAALGVSIVEPVLIIGGVTAVLSFIGTWIGDAAGHLFENKLEIIGGIILIGIGLIDLNNYDLGKVRQLNIDPDLCWATYTIPFDKVENFTFCATAYYLSRPAIQHWEQQLGGPVIWYVSSVTSISYGIERLQGLKEEFAKAQAEAEADS